MPTSDKFGQSQSFLRDTLHPPRPAQFLAVHAGNLDTDKLSRFIDDVWSDLIRRLEDPIQINEDDHTRQVVFVGTIRYIVDKNSGMFRSETLGRTEEGLKFVEEKAWIAIDPPLRANGGWIEVYLNQRWDEMAAVLIDHAKPGESWLSTVRRVFWQSIRRSTYWKRLRNAMRAALDLDPQILRWSCQGRSRHVNQCVTNHQYNRTVAFRLDYEQIERDNPSLVWLFTLMLDEKIELPPGETIAAMKTYLAGKRVTPAGWRLLANGHEHHFSHIRDWIGPDGELTGRIAELPFWLRFMVALHRSAPLRPALRDIFLHDSFNTDTNGLVRFRNVWMPVTVVNSILKEAERRLQRGGLTSFLESDVNEVVAWLEAEKPDLDINQLRAGWKYLASSASKWQVEKEMAGELGQLQWGSALRDLRIGEWVVVPLDDAWKLRSEGLRQKHCADRYLKDCLLGNKRLFSVRHADGRRVATIGIELNGDTWQSFGIKRSCNRPVGPGLAGIDQEVATRYKDLWRLTQPSPPIPPQKEEREDPTYFASPEESECPFCGAEEGHCEEHLVACYDVFDGQIVGGSLYKSFDDVENRVEKILEKAVHLGLRKIGLGDEFDDLLDSIRQDVAGGESIEDSLCNWSSRVRRSLFDVLLEQSEVVCTVTDFDGGMPGCSTTYRNYWADDTWCANEGLESRISAVEMWLDELSGNTLGKESDDKDLSDDEVLRAHETRLGLSVDKSDPMLPAVIAMERALMRMFQDQRSARSGG